MKILTASRICAALLSVALIHFAGSVLIPLLVAIMCALLLDPVVAQLEGRAISRPVASAMTLSGFVLVIFLGGWAAYRSCSQVLEQGPQYMHRLKALTATWNIHPSELHSHAGSLFGLIGSAFEGVALALFVPLLIFYLLSDKQNLVESFNTLAGKICYLPKINSDLPEMIRTFFKGNLVGGLILVGLHVILFQALGLQNSLGLALISGFLNLIPILGAPLALALPVAQGMLQWDTFVPFGALILATLSFHFLVGNIVLPQMIGTRVNVNPSALIVGLLFWGWIWGPMGFLLAIPLTSALKIALESNHASIPLANLLAARPRHVISKYRFHTEHAQKPRPAEAIWSKAANTPASGMTTQAGGLRVQEITAAKTKVATTVQ